MTDVLDSSSAAPTPAQGLGDSCEQGNGGLKSTTEAGHVIGIALAEFAALRSEIDNLANAQRSMVKLNITMVAAIAGLVLANRADAHVLLILPVASCAIGLMYQWYVLHAKHIGDYIDTTLRPLLIKRTGDDQVLGWENQLRTRVYAKRGGALPGRLSYITLFPAVTFIGLVVTVPQLNSIWYFLAWLVALALGITQVVIWWLLARRWVCWA